MKIVYVSLPPTAGCRSDQDVRAARFRAVDVGDPRNPLGAATVSEVLSALGVPPCNHHNMCLIGLRSHKRWRSSESLGLSETFYAVHHLVFGGGADGGSTGAEDRRAYLEMYASAKPDKVDPKELRMAKYTTCGISNEPLKAPVVADDLGNLYNKDAFLKMLISKTAPKELSHLNSRKSVFDVTLSALDQPVEQVQYGCPVTGLPLNGKIKFVVVRNIGSKSCQNTSLNHNGGKDQSGDAGKGDRKTKGGGTGWVVSKKAVDELPQVVAEVVGGYTSVSPLFPEGDELEAVIEKVRQRTKKHKRKPEEMAGHDTEKDKPKKLDSKTITRDSSSAAAGTTTSVSKVANLDSATDVYKSIFIDKQKETTAKNDFMTRGVSKR